MSDAPEPLHLALAEFLAEVGAGAAMLRVAYSGGADSTALLHALARWPGPALRLEAVHVDHGLHPDSGSWAEACRAFCARFDIAFALVRLAGRPARGESIEAWAREARYAALAARLGPGDWLLTAHHESDLAETLLLRLLRGAGPHGLAGIEPVRVLGRGHLARPLLHTPRAVLRDYAESHALATLSDPANVDQRYDRSYLRQEVMPRILARWPAAAATLSRSAALQREACQQLDEWADRDLAECLLPDGSLSIRQTASRAGSARRALLRRWLQQLGLPVPALRHCQELERLADARARSGCVRWPGAEVRRYRETLHAMAPLVPVTPLRLSFVPGTALETPWGRLDAIAVTGAGIARRLLACAGVEVRFRAGGERCRPTAHLRPLKKLLQELDVPPWQRNRLPLVYVADELAAVADRVICTAFRAGAGEPGWKLSWCPHPARPAPPAGE